MNSGVLKILFIYEHTLNHSYCLEYWVMELLSRESVVLSIHDSVGLLIEFTFIVKKCSRNSCHDMNLNFPFHAPGFYHSIVHVM